MATVNKDFKIKSGLIVEGVNATVNGNQILTENAGDQYILDLIGGETLVKSVSNEFDVSVAGELSIDRATVDAYYDAAGTAASEAGAVAGDLSDHEALTSGVHGVTGSVVGTTDTQDLSNKRFIDTTYFTDGVTIANEGQIAILSPSHEFEIKANYGDLGLKSLNYDIVLTPGSGKDVKWGSDVVATRAYADQAETDANLYTDGRETAITTAYETYADQAETDANSYTDTAITNLNLGTTYDAIGSAAQALADANSYTDTEVADLVASAPDLLNTLNELSIAIANNPNYATDAANAVAGRVAKSGDTMTGDLVLPGAPTLNLHAATKGYVDGEITSLDSAAQDYATTAQTNAEDYADGLGVNYDMAGAAGTAETNAKSYADGLAVNYEIAGAAATAESNAIAHADALTTDDVAEGALNDYFTDARAKASAANLLVGANLTNITITGTGAGLTITAENGVADSTTNDLEEGTGPGANLYFTDNRALTAIVNAPEIAPQAIDITWVRREEATWTPVNLASTATVHTFGTNEGSVKYLVRVISQGQSHVTELLATTDSSNNVAVVEYGTIYTSESPLATATVVWNAATSKYNLNVTTANNAAEVLVAATLLAYND